MEMLKDESFLPNIHPAYETVDELLKSEDFDAAFVCTPTFTHVDVASRMMAKKHVFVEKPMTYDIFWHHLPMDRNNVLYVAQRLSSSLVIQDGFRCV